MFSYEVALNYWEVFLLIVVRIASFVYTAPFFSMANTPQRVKLGLTFFVSVIVFTLIPDRQLVYDNVFDYAIIVIKESVTGLLLGFVCSISVRILSFAGHTIDVSMGLSMANQFDPTLKEQTSISGTLYYYVVFLLLMISGLYQFLLSAIVDTFQIIPLNGVSVNGTLYNTMLDIIKNYFIISLRIALPIFASLLIVNCVLGILAKVATQMNMFAVGMQIKLIVGFIIMFATVALLPRIGNFIFLNMRTALKAVAGGLR